MDGARNTTLEHMPKIIVVGTTSRIDNIDSALRRPGRFDREIDFPIPDPFQRTQILSKLLVAVKHALNETEISKIASLAHGYVGSDLMAVVKEASLICLQRLQAERGCDIENVEVEKLELSFEDLSSGLAKVKPSSIREVIVQVPNVKWSDIGGQEGTKQRLRETVSLPLLVIFFYLETRVV